MKYTSKVAALVFLLCLGPAVCLGEGSVVQVKAGIIIPLTGPTASWGQAMRNGSELAYRRLPQAVQNRLQLIFEDDQQRGILALSAFRKLSSIDKIDIVFVFGSQSSVAVAPLAEKLEIPLLAVTGHRAVAKDRKYVMRHWLSAEEQTRKLLPAVIQRAGKRISIISTIADSNTDYLESFRAEAKEAGLQIVADAEYNRDNTDFRAIVSRLRTLQPDGLLAALFPGQISSFTKQLREAGLHLPLFGFAHAENRSEVAAAQGSMEGFIYAAPHHSEEFLDNYQRKFGSYPEAAAGNFFDLITMVGQAIADGCHSRASINEYLHTIKDFSGALGTYSASAQSDFALKAAVRVIRGNRYEALD